MDAKKIVESKNMFSVVQEMNAGYNKFFDSKPKTSAIRSECYNNYKTCSSSSGDVQKRCAEIGNDKKHSDNNSVSELHSQKSLVQEFNPPPKSDDNDDKKQTMSNSGCRKYQCIKREQ